ncbi:glycosyltransferase family 2 protein [Nitrospirillum iridis]|uniref:Glycosyltransferase involved in cell wall biosynthesis n=1 Tax=Nitrospirillum iridis TaxID=765888 RepID=A0A7X0B5I3_9PROT|nr:glycosyltransferase involved in cell wall biosynthesis [Nitrospirillum iridis]
MPPRVTLCAIIKDEADSLLEWVAYHHLMGVDRFVVYDNGSTDGSRALLERLARRIDITVIDWPSAGGGVALSFPEARDLVLSRPDLRGFNWWGERTVGPQMRAYNHFLAYYGAETDWVLFIDADEFVVSRDGMSLPALAARYGQDPAVGAVALNWRYFGSSGQLAPDGRLVIERFTRCAPTAFSGHVHMKTLARPAALDRMLIHAGRLGAGWRYVDDRGQPVDIRDFAFTPAVSHARLWLNHYSVKSRAEFQRKRARGLAPYPDGHPEKQDGLDEEYFRRQDLNDEEDLAAAAMAPAVRAEMARLLA